MTTKKERINHIESQIHRISAAKIEAKTLSNIRNNINVRINSLKDLRNEVENISKELYYYDYIDYISSLQIDSFSLKHCGSILEDLKNAMNKFIEDSDLKYQETCHKLQKKISMLGAKRIEECFKIDSPIDESLGLFLNNCSEESKIFIENSYFKRRKLLIQKRLEDCSLDIRKHYELFIFGEIDTYTAIFGVDKLKQYSETSFPKNASLIHGFNKHLLDCLSAIFKRHSKSEIESLIIKLRRTPMIGNDKILREIFINSAIVYFNFLDDFFENDADSVEI